MSGPYTFYIDPGHGWLAVKRTELEALGIADKITPYSYQKGRTVYLEEDQDAYTFIEAKKLRGEQVERHCAYHDNGSWIRQLEAYTTEQSQ